LLEFRPKLGKQVVDARGPYRFEEPLGGRNIQGVNREPWKQHAPGPTNGTHGRGSSLGSCWHCNKKWEDSAGYLSTSDHEHEFRRRRRENYHWFSINEEWKLSAGVASRYVPDYNSSTREPDVARRPFPGHRFFAPSLLRDCKWPVPRDYPGAFSSRDGPLSESLRLRWGCSRSAPKNPEWPGYRGRLRSAKPSSGRNSGHGDSHQWHITPI